MERQEQLDGRGARFPGRSCNYNLAQERANSPYISPTDSLPDLLRCRTLHLCIRLGHAHRSRPALPYLLRPLWPRAPGSLQRHHWQRAQGRQRQGEVLPTSLSIMALTAYWVSKGWIQESIPYGTVMTGTLLEFHPVVLLFLAHGCCMLSKTLHVPKP
jgi:hypothetical protein